MDLDVSLKSDFIALLQKNSEGANELHIHRLKTKELTAVIGPQHLPQGPRFSPDGRRLAFFGDSRLYLHDTDQQITNVLFDQPDLYALRTFIFCISQPPKSLCLPATPRKSIVCRTGPLAADTLLSCGSISMNRIRPDGSASSISLREMSSRCPKNRKRRTRSGETALRPILRTSWLRPTVPIKASCGSFV